MLRQLNPFVEWQIQGLVDNMLSFLLAARLVVVVPQDFLQFRVFPPHIDCIAILVIVAFDFCLFLVLLGSRLSLPEGGLFVFLLLLPQFLVLLVFTLALHRLQMLLLLLLVALVALTDLLLHLYFALFSIYLLLLLKTLFCSSTLISFSFFILLLSTFILLKF